MKMDLTFKENAHKNDVYVHMDILTLAVQSFLQGAIKFTWSGQVLFINHKNVALYH